MLTNELLQRSGIMPYQYHEACIFKNFTFLAVVLLNLWAIMWRPITENDYAIAVLEIWLNIILLREHRLSFVWKTKAMVMEIFQKLILSRAVVVSGSFK